MTLEEKAEQYALDTYELIEEGQYSDRRARIQGYLAGAEPREKRIEELEKENAELKLKLEALDEQTPWKDIKDKSEVIGKLTKATELIQNIIRVTWGEGWSYSLDWKEKAEQFIKEIEK